MISKQFKWIDSATSEIDWLKQQIDFVSDNTKTSQQKIEHQQTVTPLLSTQSDASNTCNANNPNCNVNTTHLAGANSNLPLDVMPKDRQLNLLNFVSSLCGWNPWDLDPSECYTVKDDEQYQILFFDASQTVQVFGPLKLAMKAPENDSYLQVVDDYKQWRLAPFGFDEATLMVRATKNGSKCDDTDHVSVTANDATDEICDYIGFQTKTLQKCITSIRCNCKWKIRIRSCNRC